MFSTAWTALVACTIFSCGLSMHTAPRYSLHTRRNPNMKQRIPGGPAEEEQENSPMTNSTSRTEPGGEGDDVPLTEAGYQQVASLKSDGIMSKFIHRLLGSYGKLVGNEGDLAGLVPFYSGTVGAQNLDKLQSELWSASWVLNNTENKKEESRPTGTAPVESDPHFDQQMSLLESQQEEVKSNVPLDVNMIESPVLPDLQQGNSTSNVQSNKRRKQNEIDILETEEEEEEEVEDDAGLSEEESLSALSFGNELENAAIRSPKKSHDKHARKTKKNIVSQMHPFGVHPFGETTQLGKTAHGTKSKTAAKNDRYDSQVSKKSGKRKDDAVESEIEEQVGTKNAQKAARGARGRGRFSSKGQGGLKKHARERDDEASNSPLAKKSKKSKGDKKELKKKKQSKNHGRPKPRELMERPRAEPKTLKGHYMESTGSDEADQDDYNN